jgi:probable rRNA maturation factor
MVHVQIDEIYVPLVSSDAIKRAAERTLQHEGVTGEGDLSVVITDDSHLQQLNRQFLGVDSATDVLSFPDRHVDPETGDIYLGDVIVSYPRAVEQASVAGHPPGAELSLLTIHGVLHLLGHDHRDEEEKAVMWAAQAEILAELDLEAEPPS